MSALRQAALAALVCGAAGLPPSPAAAQGITPTPPPLPAERHTRHALVIGIGEYSQAATPPLPGVVHDMASARQMAHAMAIPDANITVLRDREATGARIRAEIDALQSRLAEGDRVFVYYSGHGTRWSDPEAPAGGCTEGLLTADGDVLTNAEMGRRLAPLARRADKMLVFYDACFSGGVAGAPARSRNIRGAGAAAITPKFTPAGASGRCQASNYRSRGLTQSLQQARALPQNVVHIAASRPDEISFDNSAIGGFATAAWRDCLLGEARDTDGSGAITAQEVTACAQAKVTAGLAGQDGITGQQLTIAGNAGFVPAWMGEAFAPAPPAPPVAPAVPAAPPALPLSPPAPPPLRQATPADILAEVHAQRDGSRNVAASVRQPRLRIDTDALEIDVTAGRDGYLYVALAGSDGQSLYLLYPNTLAADNRVRAGQRVSLPDKRWEIIAGGPPGLETLLVMLTDAPRDLSALGREKVGPFMRSLLDAQGRARLQWVLGNGTPADGCGKPGQGSCSDAFGAALLTVQTVP